ncbi:unnamed protein product, partial [Staurois parvus]
MFCLCELISTDSLIQLFMYIIYTFLFCLHIFLSPVLCPQSLVISCTVRSLWSSPVLSAVSGHLLYCVCSLWSSPVLSAVSGHLLYCPQSLVI